MSKRESPHPPHGPSLLEAELGNLIDGARCPAAGGEFVEVENPASMEVFAKVPRSRDEDVAAAVESGVQAFEDRRWRSMDPRARLRVLMRAANLLRERRGELAVIESSSNGRPVREMRAQLGRVPEWLEYFAALAVTEEGAVPPISGSNLNYVIREPVGVAAQITPWNHPLLIATKKLAPALAAGNSVIVKPSELAPITPHLLAETLLEAELPPGVVNVVHGLGSEAGRALVAEPRIARVDITGGTETGRMVAEAAGRNLASVTAELGGKAPLLIFPDVEVCRAVAGAAFAAFIASGQSCIQGARLLVHEDFVEEFSARLGQLASAIRLGDPLDSATQMGPLASAAHRNRVMRYVAEAVRSGVPAVCGGGQPTADELSCGYFIEPTVLGPVDPSLPIAREEVFGPVTCIIPFASEEEAISLANDSPFGLAAGIWTENVARAHRVARALDVGVVWINDHHRVDPSSPWGGTKDSGIGRESGKEAFRFYTQTKSVIVDTEGGTPDWFTTTGDARYN
jgi:phenylacetaldehyde dehydrogenase